MASHSSIFAWRIPWTEEPGGLLFSLCLFQSAALPQTAVELGFLHCYVRSMAHDVRWVDCDK